MILICSIVFYASETLALRKTNIIFDTFKRKILRWIYGTCLNSKTREWRIQTYEELINMFQKPHILREAAKRLM